MLYRHIIGSGLMVVALSSLIAISGGCQGGGTIDGSVNTAVLGVPAKAHVKVTFGPAQAPPSDLSFQGRICIGSVCGDVYVDSNGTQWFKDSDGDYHPITGPVLVFPVLNTTVGSLRNLVNITHPVTFSFNTDLDTASVHMIIPVEMIESYTWMSDLPFLVTGNEVQLTGGDMIVTYHGTINDVLGAIMYQGVVSAQYDDQLLGTVRMTFNYQYQLVSMATDSGIDWIEAVVHTKVND